MFRNCLKFHDKGSEFYTHGKTLEEFLDTFLEQWLPDFAYETYETMSKPTFNPLPSTSGTGKKRNKNFHSLIINLHRLVFIPNKTIFTV